MLLDFCALVLSYPLSVGLFFLASGTRFDDDFLVYYLGNPRIILMILTFSAFMVLVYHTTGIYRNSAVRLYRQDIQSFIGLNLAGVFAMAAGLYFIKNVLFSRPILAVFYVISLGLLALIHGVVRIRRRTRAEQGMYVRHIAVVGSGPLAETFCQAIKKNPKYSCDIVGYFGEKTDRELGLRLGGYSTIAKWLENNDVDEIVVALEPDETSKLDAVLSEGDREGVRLSIVPFYNKFIPANTKIESYGDVRTIDVRSIPLDSLGNSVLKRAFDIVFSLAFILLFWWVYVIVAIGVRSSSPGPVLFKQERLGRNKKTFTMYKFRSMKVNDEQSTAWTVDDDPRKTKFGSFIRKYSLDEIPQFINVLKGDMSVVGPRPELPYHANRFKNHVPLYMVRHQVRPGITGWAQVEGYRGDTSIAKRAECDVWYIEHWSFILDIKICVRTLFGGLKNNESLK